MSVRYASAPGPSGAWTSGKRLAPRRLSSRPGRRASSGRPDERRRLVGGAHATVEEVPDERERDPEHQAEQQPDRGVAHRFRLHLLGLVRASHESGRRSLQGRGRLEPAKRPAQVTRERRFRVLAQARQALLDVALGHVQRGRAEPRPVAHVLRAVGVGQAAGARRIGVAHLEGEEVRARPGLHVGVVEQLLGGLTVGAHSPEHAPCQPGALGHVRLGGGVAVALVRALAAREVAADRLGRVLRVEEDLRLALVQLVLRQAEGEHGERNEDDRL